MKKFLLTLAVAMFSLAGVAETTTRTFTDKLVVTVDGEESTMDATVEVEMLEDNYINFVLKNFILVSDGDDMPVGNIEIKNLFTRNKGDYSSFSYNANLQIKEGDAEGYDTWVGPDLGNVPLVLKGKLSDDKLYVSIDIDMKSLEQIISVKFGSDFVETPSVVSTREYSVAVPVLGVVNFGEAMGVESDFGTSDAKVIISELSNNDILFSLQGIAVSVEGTAAPLGNLNMMLEPDLRGGYSAFSGSLNAMYEGDGAALAGVESPITIKGKYNDDNIYFDIVSVVDLMQMDFHYVYGTDFAPATPAGEPKVYSDNLVVTVNEDTTPEIPANVSVTPLTDGGINFSLKNFTLLLEGDELPIGNITIEDLKLYEGQGYKYFNYNGNLLISEGDDASVDTWAGPDLGIIPLRLRGRMTDEKLCVYIDIDMESLEQIIYVQFGQPIEPEETAISSVAQSNNKPSAIFDLTGRKVSAAKHGIYVIDGKKVLK